MRAPVLLALLALAGMLSCSDGPTSPGDATALRVSSPAVALEVGDSVMLSVSGVSANGEPVSVSGVTFTSLDTQIATVDQRGMVYGVAAGMARIEVKAGALRDTFRLSVGGRLQFNVSSTQACSMPTLRDARIVTASDHAIIAEDLNNPAGGFTDAQYRHIAVTFDTLVYPVVTSAFGNPRDVDGNERVVILYTSAVNELTARGSQSFVAGFFFSRDLFPTESRNGLQGCQASNQAEMFYMLAPDPEGAVNGNKRTSEFVMSRTIATVGHEFQHLINASRRLFESDASEFETIWLNEGLSHIAEEMLFYEAAGLGPGQRLNVEKLRSRATQVSAFNMYGGGNFGRLAKYMETPSSESPYEMDDNLATRGATWSFLRYAADRAGRNNPAFWQALSGAPTVGFANLDAAFGTSTRQWVADWAVANAADRFQSTNPVEEKFRHKSWDMHDIMDELNLSTLKTIPLSNGETSTVDIKAGGSAHVRFRIGADDASILSSLQGNTAPSCGSSGKRTLKPGEVVQGTLAQLGALCLAGAPSNQYFVLTATHQAPTEGTTATLVVSGSGLLSPPQASIASQGSGLALSRARALEGVSEPAASFEYRLRKREIEELGWRIPQRGAPSLQTSGGSSEVILALMRIW
ncbi:MAG TPA: Ig-like domain-containing protein [Gemmatimonadales bacterium]|nr:Ig-like domain-containing protein [Gemmatimonadales bacterium]